MNAHLKGLLLLLRLLLLFFFFKEMNAFVPRNVFIRMYRILLRNALDTLVVMQLTGLIKMEFHVHLLEI